MAGRTTKRTTRRTKTLEAIDASPATPAPTPAPAPTPEPAPAPEPAPPQVHGEWVPIVYEGEGLFADADAGVFARGTRTRLRAQVAARLLGISGFRAAA
jgi:hypothetical protein